MSRAWLSLVMLLLAGCQGDGEAPATTSAGESASAGVVAPAHPPSPATATATGVGVHDALPPLDGGPPPGFGKAPSRAAVSSSGDAAPILRAVRTGRHEGFDRIVFEFDSGGLPQWDIAHLEAPPRDCGSGAEVPLAGEATLQVRFSGARAHTEAGEGTSGPRRRTVGLPVVRELVRTCDFEAEVTWVAGLATRAAYRTRVLADPARLVVDLAH